MFRILESETMMFGLLGLFGLFILITLFMPWVQMARLRRLDDDMMDLRARLSKIEKSKVIAVASVPVADQKYETTPIHERDHLTTQNQPIVPQSVYALGVEDQGVLEADVPVSTKAPIDQNESGQGFEFNLAAKLPVWIGSLSLICAGFFLVKYSIDAGWLGPLPRVILGGAMGLFLLMAGQWLNRQYHIDNHIRISQGAIGAGLVTLYFSTYAAVNLYHLIPNVVGFALMAIITAVGIILSIRHGQAIAVFGLLGGLLTPALITSSEPNAAALFTYLFILFAGIMFVLARQGWWITAALALVGIYIWMALFIGTVFHAADLSILTLFITATCAVACFATQYASANTHDQYGHDVRPIFNIGAIAAGLITILILNVKVSLSLFDWSLLGLLSIGGISLTFFKPDIYRIPVLGQMALTLVLFGLWSAHAPLMETIMVVLGMTSIYGVLTYVLMRQVADPRPLAILQVVGLIGLYTIAHYQVDLPAAVLAYSPWAMIGLVVMGYFAHQTLHMRTQYLAEQQTQDHLVGIYALGATAALSLAMVFTLPMAYLPLAFATQTAATMWVYSRIRMDALPKIMLALVIVGVMFNGKYLWMFVDIIANSLVGEFTDSGRQIAILPFDKVWVHLILPTAFLIITAVTKQINQIDVPTTLNKWLYGGIVGHTLALLYMTIRHCFVGMDRDSFIYATEAGFIERGVITTALALFGITLLQARKRLIHSEALIPYGRFIIAIAAARLFYFDLFLHNPYYHADQNVGSWLVLNGITLTYGLGGGFILAIISSNQLALHQKNLRRLLKIFAGLMLFMFVSMTVRQYFHDGILSDVPTSHEEFYAYSIVWLLTGIGLLLVGLSTGNQGARQASLAFMILTVGKVFLFDADELEGLYRVFSFLGLGLSLMGLSFLYTKALKVQNTKGEEKSGPWWF